MKTSAENVSETKSDQSIGESERKNVRFERFAWKIVIPHYEIAQKVIKENSNKNRNDVQTKLERSNSISENKRRMLLQNGSREKLDNDGKSDSEINKTNETIERRKIETSKKWKKSKLIILACFWFGFKKRIEDRNRTFIKCEKKI